MINEITLPDYREMAWRLLELCTEHGGKYAVEQIEEALKHAQKVGETLARQPTEITSTYSNLESI